MSRLLTLVFAVFAWAVFQGPVMAQAFTDDLAPSRAISVPKNKSMAFRLTSNAAEVVVTQPEVAQIVANDDRSVYVRGVELGSTNILVYDGSHRLIEVVDVNVGFDAASAQTEITRALPTEKIVATSFNGGTVTEDSGIITYTPAPGFDGLDGFTYTVDDGWGGISAAGTVLITVNAVSDPAPGPLTLAVDLGGGTVTGSFTGSPGTSYTLERSTTLEELSWTPVDTQVAPGSGDVVITDNSPPPGKAFYRISYTP